MGGAQALLLLVVCAAAVGVLEVYEVGAVDVAPVDVVAVDCAVDRVVDVGCCVV